MGVMGFAEGDIDQLIAEDETIAEEIDQQRLEPCAPWPTATEAHRPAPRGGGHASR